MTNALSTTAAFNGVVSALVKIAEGEVELRQHVADYVNAGGTIKELHVQLQNLDDSRCHKSYNYLRQVQSRCRQVGLLPEATQGRRGDPMGSLPVENPEALSQLLPTKRDVQAYAKAPVEVKEQVVALSNFGPYHCASPADQEKILELTDDGSFPEVEKVHPGTYPDRVLRYVRSLIDADNYSIDTSGCTDEQKDDMILQLNTGFEAFQQQMFLWNMEMADTFGCFDQETGAWNQYSDIQIIKNIIPRLSESQRQQVINLLLSPIEQ